MNAALKRGDLVEAGHYRRIMEDFLGDDEDNVSVPSEASEDEPQGEDSTGVERGDAGPSANTNGDARLTTSPSTSEGEPEMHPGTQVDAYVDSQGTMVDDSSQASTDSDASVSARPALDFKTVFRST